MILLASLIVGAAIVWSALRVASELRAARDARSREQAGMLLQLFAPVIAAAQADPRAFLVGQPIAAIARRIYPAESAVLDAAAGGTFPFTSAQLQAAHAQWTTEWLAWERTHDAEYKLKAAEAQAALIASASSDAARMKVDAVEREKLDVYQRRYAEYVRVSKALQALIPPT